MVPEDLEELRRIEIAKLGRCGATRNLDAPHPGMQHILRREAKRRERAEGRRWAISPPIYDNAQDQRRLKLFDAIFRALAKRGHGCELSDGNDGLEGRVQIGETLISFRIEPRGEASPWGGTALASKKRLSSRVQIDRFYQASEFEWKDEPSKRLESQIHLIAAGLIVAGEAWYRELLKRSEEFLAARERDEEERREERANDLERRQIEALNRNAGLLREAEDIRSLISEVQRRFELGDLPVQQSELTSWVERATQHANKIDPILSGAIVRGMKLED